MAALREEWRMLQRVASSLTRRKREVGWLPRGNTGGLGFTSTRVSRRHA